MFASFNYNGILPFSTWCIVSFALYLCTASDALVVPGTWYLVDSFENPMEWYQVPGTRFRILFLHMHNSGDGRLDCSAKILFRNVRSTLHNHSYHGKIWAVFEVITKAAPDAQILAPDNGIPLTTIPRKTAISQIQWKPKQICQYVIKGGYDKRLLPWSASMVSWWRLLVSSILPKLPQWLWLHAKS